MNAAELKKLRAYLHSLSGQARALERIENPTGQSVIDSNAVEIIAQEIAEIEKAFPGLLPTFRGQDFFSHDVGRGTFYRVMGLLLYLRKAIGRLEIAAEEDDSTPVTESRDFTYIGDNSLRTILVRDYADAQRTFITAAWKATIILSGGAIEAILLDQLRKDEGAARAASKAPKQNDLSRWDLADLISVAVELKVVGPGVDKLSHSVREYRNLVHPGNEVRNRLTVGKEEARIALEILNMVDRELRP